MKNQSLLRKLLALLLALPLLMSAQDVTFWNFSDTEMFPNDTLWETTTLHGLTFVTDGSSIDRVPIFQSCSDRTWTSDDGMEVLTFTQRLKINGKSSSAYRWVYFTANPGDTIEVWGNSTSSSSARTLTFKSGGYNGVSCGDVDLATLPIFSLNNLACGVSTLIPDSTLPVSKTVPFAPESVIR